MEKISKIPLRITIELPNKRVRKCRLSTEMERDEGRGKSTQLGG